MMTRIHRYLAPCALLLLALAPMSFAAGTDALVEDLACDDALVRAEAVEGLTRLGASAIPALFDLIQDDDKRTAAGARIALGMLVQTSTARTADREAVVEALLTEAKSDRPGQIRSVALRQLAFVGGAECVPDLVALLGDPHVADMARFALTRIPGEEATGALIASLETADPERRVGIVNSLGDRAAVMAVPALVPLCSEGPEPQRLAAVRALGRIPSADCIAPLASARKAGSSAVREAARLAYAELGEALLEAGLETEAAVVFADLYRTGPTDQERCAGLGGLAKTSGVAAVPTLLDAVATGGPALRGVAEHALAEMPEATVTASVVDALRKARPAVRPAFLRVLAMRRDPTAVPAICAAMLRSDDEGRIAALSALAAIGDDAGAPSAVTALERGSKPLQEAALAALARMPGERAAAAIAAAIPGAEPGVRATLVRLLGYQDSAAGDARITACLDDPDKDVRLAAISALGRRQSGEAVTTLFGVSASGDKDEAAAATAALATMRGKEADQTLVAIAWAGEPPARTAAVKAIAARGQGVYGPLLIEVAQSAPDEVAAAALDGLAALRDPEALPVVVRAARAGSGEKQAAAIRAYLAIAATVSSVEARTRMYCEALDLAKTEDETAAALRSVATVATGEALPLVQPFLTDKREPVRKAAAVAFVPIASALAAEGRQAEAVELLMDLLPLLEDRAAVTDAAQAMRAFGLPLRLAEKDGYLTEYWVLGPIGSRDGLAKEDAFPTGGPVDVAQPVSHGGRTVGWRFCPVDDPQGLLDLEKAAARQDNTGAYAYVEFTVAEAREAVLKVGSDDDVACWLNGAKVHEFAGNRGWTKDQDVVPVELAKGVNTLLCRVLNGGAQWSMSARLTDEAGKPIPLKQWDMTPASLVAREGFVTRFAMLAPLPGREAVRASDVVPSVGPDLTKPVRFASADHRWRWISVEDASGGLDLIKVFGQKDDVGCYLYAEVTAPEAADVLLKMGSDDDVYCWLNGELVHSNTTPRPWVADQDVVEAHLRAGKNTLLLKVLQAGGGWEASVRITDRAGTPLVLDQRAH